MSETPGQQYAEDLTGLETLPPGIPAVPVYLTQPAPTHERAATSYTVGQYAPPVEGTALPVLLAGFMPTRSRLVLRNLGAATVWIAPDPSAATHTSAFPVLAGEAREIKTSEAVWAATDASASGPSLVAVLAEFTSGS